MSVRYKLPPAGAAQYLRLNGPGPFHIAAEVPDGLYVALCRLPSGRRQDGAALRGWHPRHAAEVCGRCRSAWTRRAAVSE